MNVLTGKYAGATPTTVLTSKARVALHLLLEAHETAELLNQDNLAFALEIQALKEAGLNHNDLRSLVCQGLAIHLLERTNPGAARRIFRQPCGLRLQAKSCFLLSEAGLLRARELCALRAHPQPNGWHLDEHAADGLVPLWDSDRRELRLGELLIKSFRQPAPNQEIILSAFQEEGWPPRIDNPLPGNCSIDAVDRLHDAVKKLNRQANCLVRFRSDGNGLGVQWFLAIATAPSAS
jgi:hypothetical protein